LEVNLFLCPALKSKFNLKKLRCWIRARDFVLDHFSG